MPWWTLAPFVVSAVRDQRPPQVTFRGEDEVPQAFLAEGAPEAFDVGIGVRGAVGDGQPLDAQDLVQPLVQRASVALSSSTFVGWWRASLPKDPVVVVDQEPWDGSVGASVIG